jgi:ferredoxin
LGTGPFLRGGYDLAVTELGDELLLRAGTPEGRDLLELLKGRKPTQEDLRREEDLKRRAEASVRRRVEVEGLPERLLRKLESPVWEEIASRCLGCGSCTLVCPTCFCYEVLDDVSFDGSLSLRFRRWDVCFREGFSAVHGTPLRKSLASRYRQWLLHKFSYWSFQFGTLGCVGCGRCITWCPVGIDITEEVKRVLSDG